MSDAPLFASLKKKAPYTLINADCVEAMRDMTDASVDAVVCDPPYLLADTSKNNLNCLSRILSEVFFPKDQGDDSKLIQKSNFGSPLVLNSDLRIVDRPIFVDSRITVPVSSVDLKNSTIIKHKIDAGTVSACSAISKSDLSLEFYAQRFKNHSDFILQPADGTDATFCHGACGCFTEPSFGQITMLVRTIGASNAPDALSDFGVANGSDGVRFNDDALGCSTAAPSVMTGTRTIDTFMLRLDLRRGTGELHPAVGTDNRHTAICLKGCEFASTNIGTSLSASMPLKAYRINEINCGTNGTFTLYLPDHVTHLLSSLTRGGFMGKYWDGQETPQSSYRFHLAWVREALRVLKPGGHLLAFGGTRTYHRLACAIEDAGFEIRDCIMWCYGSGFPKSHSVSKAIEKSGKSNAKAWQGWGSALKPAYEPVVVGRKPLDGTIAANTLKHGVGGLNIDGCRVATSHGDEVSLHGRAPTENGWDARWSCAQTPGQTDGQKLGRFPANFLLSHSPSCVHLDTADDTDLWACVPGCPVRAMDAQSGPSGGCAPASGPTLGKLGKHGIYGKASGENMEKVAFHGKVDGASRFFMRFDPNDAPFIYQAKANTKDRSAGVEGRNFHPTVKSTALMAYLCRLVTPPSGVVLDPFMGSGSTGVACMKEGFRFIGIEREAEYYEIAKQRVEHANKETGR